jgi:hypothetical protein
MKPDRERRLELLEAYVVKGSGKSPQEFWVGFQDLASDLDLEAFAEDAEPELRERYTALLANADEAGFVVPEEAMEEPGLR